MMARYIPPSDRALWDRYLVVLEQSGVEPDRRRWYVLRRFCQVDGVTSK